MIRIYFKNNAKTSTSRTVVDDAAARLRYVQIDGHPLSPLPLDISDINPTSVAFVSFGHQFGGTMKRGLYKYGVGEDCCEAHVSGGREPNDRSVIMKAPSIAHIREMWMGMCRKDGALEPYLEM